MPDRLGLAAAHAGFAYDQPIVTSDAAKFFRSIPRWSGAPTEFDFSTEYLVPVALTALISTIIGLVVIGLLFAFLVARYTCSEREWDARSTRMARKKGSNVIQLGLSASLMFLIFTFLSLALVGTHSVSSSATDVIDSAKGMLNDMSRTGSSMVDVVVLLRKRLSEDFNVSAILQEEVFSAVSVDIAEPALSTLQDYTMKRIPDVSRLRSALTVLLTNIKKVVEVIEKAVSSTYAGLAVIVLLQLLGPLLLFLSASLSHYKSRPSRALQILFHVLFLLVPALLSWVLLGVASAVGAVVADVCTSLHVYRNVLLGEMNATSVTGNAFVDTNLLCPSIISASGLQEQINATVDSLLQSQLVNSTVLAVLKTSSSDLADAAIWTGEEVTKFVDCSSFIATSGQIELNACGNFERSSIAGIFDLWASFLGLTLCLSVAFIASVSGIRVAGAILLWSQEEEESFLEEERGQSFDGEDQIREGL